MAHPMKKANQVARRAATILAVSVFLSTIASLPAATQGQTATLETKAIENELRAEFEGRIWELRASNASEGVRIKPPQEERGLFEAGAPLLLHIGKVRAARGRIEITARRVILFQQDGNWGKLQTRNRKFTFSARNKNMPLEAIAAALRLALIPESTAMGWIQREWISELPDNPEDGKKAKDRESVEVAPGVFTVGKGIKAPRCVDCPSPDFSEQARLARVSGTVVLKVIVTEGGWTSNLTIIEMAGFGLDEGAVRAVAHWRYKPGMKDGKPVSVVTKIHLNFSVR